MSGLDSHRKKWLSRFAGSTSAIIFQVDLASYDQFLADDWFSNLLVRCMLSFESMCDSEWFKNKEILLVMDNAIECARKLALISFKDLFTDYAGPDEIESVIKYLMLRFRAFSGTKTHRQIPTHVAAPGGLGVARFVIYSVQDILTQETLRTNLGL